MKKIKFLSSISAVSTNFSLSLQRFFAGMSVSVSRRDLANLFSAVLVFFLLAAGIFGSGCLIIRALNPNYDFSPVFNFFRLPSAPASPETGTGQQNLSSGKTDIPVPELPENSGETVKPGEEIRDVIGRQLKEQVLADPAFFGLKKEDLEPKEKLDRFLDKKISQIMIANGIIRDDGHILTVAPGTKVILTLEGHVRIIGDSYFQNAGQTSVEGLQGPAD